VAQEWARPIAERRGAPALLPWHRREQRPRQHLPLARLPRAHRDELSACRLQAMRRPRPARAATRAACRHLASPRSSAPTRALRRRVTGQRGSCPTSRLGARRGPGSAGCGRRPRRCSWPWRSRGLASAGSALSSRIKVCTRQCGTLAVPGSSRSSSSSSSSSGGWRRPVHAACRMQLAQRRRGCTRLQQRLLPQGPRAQRSQQQQQQQQRCRQREACGPPQWRQSVRRQRLPHTRACQRCCLGGHPGQDRWRTAARPQQLSATRA
jgi:hypothetical protein